MSNGNNIQVMSFPPPPQEFTIDRAIFALVILQGAENQGLWHSPQDFKLREEARDYLRRWERHFQIPSDTSLQAVFNKLGI